MRAWRKPIVLSIVVLAAVVSAAAADAGGRSARGEAGVAAAPSGTLRLFGYEDAFVPKVLDPLHKLYPGVSLKTATFSSNDEAVAKIRGGFKTDIINICTDDTARLIRLGMIQPIDTTKVPAWKSLFGAFKRLPGVVQDGKVWMIPVDGGTGGILYNPARTKPVTTWRALFERPDLKGRIALEDSAESTIAVGAFALGYKDPYKLSNADLDRVRDYLMAHRSQIRTFYAGDADFLSLYKSHEIDAGFAYHDYRVTAARAGTPGVYSTANGGLAWFCGWGIAKSADNLPAAYAALNYYASPVPQKFYGTSYTYMVSNPKTIAALPPTLVRQIGLDHPERLQNLTAFNLPPNYDKWLQIYTELKAA
jgi:spermidine/putrescine transport system substrate-binding protein